MAGPVRPAALWRSRLSDGLLLVPGIGWLLLFFFVPLVIIFVILQLTKSDDDSSSAATKSGPTINLNRTA